VTLPLGFAIGYPPPTPPTHSLAQLEEHLLHFSPTMASGAASGKPGSAVGPRGGAVYGSTPTSLLFGKLKGKAPLRAEPRPATSQGGPAGGTSAAPAAPGSKGGGGAAPGTAVAGGSGDPRRVVWGGPASAPTAPSPPLYDAQEMLVQSPPHGGAGVGVSAVDGWLPASTSDSPELALGMRRTSSPRPPGRSSPRPDSRSGLGPGASRPPVGAASSGPKAGGGKGSGGGGGGGGGGGASAAAAALLTPMRSPRQPSPVEAPGPGLLVGSHGEPVVVGISSSAVASSFRPRPHNVQEGGGPLGAAAGLALPAGVVGVGLGSGQRRPTTAGGGAGASATTAATGAAATGALAPNVRRDGRPATSSGGDGSRTERGLRLGGGGLLAPSGAAAAGGTPTGAGGTPLGLGVVGVGHARHPRSAAAGSQSARGAGSHSDRDPRGAGGGGGGGAKGWAEAEGDAADAAARLLSWAPASEGDLGLVGPGPSGRRSATAAMVAEDGGGGGGGRGGGAPPPVVRVAAVLPRVAPPVERGFPRTSPLTSPPSVVAYLASGSSGASASASGGAGAGASGPSAAASGGAGSGGPIARSPPSYGASGVVTVRSLMAQRSPTASPTPTHATAGARDGGFGEGALETPAREGGGGGAVPIGEVSGGFDPAAFGSLSFDGSGTVLLESVRALS
jgi:hypothetical protein